MSYEAVEAVYKIIWCYLRTTHTSALSLREKMRECEVESASGPNGPPQQSEKHKYLNYE